MEGSGASPSLVLLDVLFPNARGYCIAAYSLCFAEYFAHSSFVTPLAGSAMLGLLVASGGKGMSRAHLSQRLVFGRLCFARASALSPRLYLCQFRAYSLSDGFGSSYGYGLSFSGIHPPRSLVLRAPLLRAGEGGRARRVDRSPLVGSARIVFSGRCSRCPCPCLSRPTGSAAVHSLSGLDLARRKHTPYSYACPCPAYQHAMARKIKWAAGVP
ncbi:hypothetical protein B0H14DRAFT_656236 [Mycena olivaceomarginata]|nr:hypothetical protein B0H14DRAFT_656236 [Mycena olivaceomarginata]